MRRLILICCIMACVLTALPSISIAETDNASSTRIGYYRQPTIHNETIVFVAEGDLWKIDLGGDIAQRLTTHPGLESLPAISPDGKLVAFTGQYEGPTDVYVIPVTGGLPTRITFYGRRARVAGWTPSGKVLVATYSYATLPSRQLVEVDPKTLKQVVVPLAQAAEGCYGQSEKTLFFTRLGGPGSYTKRYKGGTAQNLWKFTKGDPEAIPLTTDYPGTSSSPMWYDGRVYFASDRDGTMNIWSSDENGGDLRQETKHVGWEAKSPSLSNGKIVYQLKADLYLHDINSGDNRKLAVTLSSDFDQLRENWIDKPIDYMTTSHISPDGEHVVLTARGDLFVVPRKSGRLVEATHDSKVRYRSGRYLPDGKSLLALTDATGELEFWKVPANGVGKPDQLTDDGTVFRFDGIPSPDGSYIACKDHVEKLWIHDVKTGSSVFVDSCAAWGMRDIVWSPDSRWLAYVNQPMNFLGQIFVYDLKNERITPVTSERFMDDNPCWSPDGKWLYFLSDRDVSTVYPGVWTLTKPFPHIDKTTKLYLLPLQKGLRSPFEPDNELTPAKKDDDRKDSDKKDDDKKSADTSSVVEIDFDNIQQRIMEVPVPAGNYGSLDATKKQLYWLSSISGSRNRTLQTIEIKNEDAEVKDLTDDVGSFEMSLDGKKMLIRKSGALYITDASGTSKMDLGKAKVNLSDWTFTVKPAEEWHQMFVDAWRLERDYFYDPGMHGVDWTAVRDKYLPLVSRITDRYELSDLLGEMIGELSALHMYIFGGEHRQGPDDIAAGFLGALLSLDESAGGYRVDYIYRSDPDEPQHLSPLARPGVDVSEGDIIKEINGVSTMSVPCIDILLRKKVGKQVLLTVGAAHSQNIREVIVEPIRAWAARNLRYRDWEFSRRLKVDEAGNEDIGYVHLRATGTGDYGQWWRDFYPVINRKGLIIDMRHNGGGNVDSWILTSLLRRPWAYWKSRVGVPYPNMQNSFNGYIVVLCNEHTGSDGELFCEGFRRLGLGKVIGVRTWGGEIWLSYNNWMVDRGIASAAQSGVYGPEGEWLIEGHGFEPDIVVDNLPHATFNGSDAQLEAAIKYLLEQIEKDPPSTPASPPYPDKSFKAGQ